MLERKGQIEIPDFGVFAQTRYRVLRDAYESFPFRLQSNTFDLLQIAIKRWSDDCRLARLTTNGIFICIIPPESLVRVKEMEDLDSFFEHGQGKAVDVSITSYWSGRELKTKLSDGYNASYLNIFGKVLESMQYAKICRYNYGKEIVHLVASDSFI